MIWGKWRGREEADLEGPLATLRGLNFKPQGGVE